jgi:hypothetical protein
LTPPRSLAAIFKHYTRRHAYARITACGLCRVCGMYCENSYFNYRLECRVVVRMDVVRMDRVRSRFKTEDVGNGKGGKDKLAR